jgi:hypothetical protein
VDGQGRDRRRNWFLLNPPRGRILASSRQRKASEYEILFDKILHVPTEEMELHDPFYLGGMYILDPEFEKDPTMIKKMASDVNQVYAHFIKNRLNGFAKRAGYDGINFGDKLMLIIT